MTTTTNTTRNGPRARRATAATIPTPTQTMKQIAADWHAILKGG